jgi:iron complex outermembrane receptor protein
MMKLRTFVWLIASLAGSTQAFAQGSASIQGVVLDPSAKAIGNATVIVRSDRGAQTATTTTDGHFSVGDLSAGIYDVEVTATGFSNGLKEGLKLVAGKTFDVSFTLTVAPFTEEVTVSSTLPEEIKSAPSQGSLSARMPESIISENFVRNFTPPQSDYAQIVALSPGSYSVAPNGPGLGDTKTNFRAFSDVQLTIKFDGIPFNDTNDSSHHSWVFFPAPFTGGAEFDRSPGTAASIGRRPSAARSTCSRATLRASPDDRQPLARNLNTQLYDVDYNSGQLGANGRTDFVVMHTTCHPTGLPDVNSQRRDAFMGKVRYNARVVPADGFSSVIDVFSHTPNQKGPTRAQVEQFGDNFLMTNDPRRRSITATTSTTCRPTSSTPAPAAISAMAGHTTTRSTRTAITTIRTSTARRPSTRRAPPTS